MSETKGFNWRSVPLPPKMQHLPKDKRGMSIPEVILKDANGAHFVINDEETRQRHIREQRCAISGLPLHRGRWYVGGPLSAFHPQGRYIDTPMHYECVEYALKVCPYLAARSYSKMKDPASLTTDGSNLIFVDPTMDPDRPSVFVAAMAIGEPGYHVEPLTNRVAYLSPRRPYRQVEFWKGGRRLDFGEGMDLIFSGASGEKMQKMNLTPNMILTQIKR